MTQTSVPAPDGGWGWVVAFFSLLVLAHTNGLMLSMSVMYVSWLEEFGESRGGTSWIISIVFAAMFGLGPLAASLANQIGFRASTAVGGFLTGFGFVLSYFATSVEFLIVSVGIISGIGCAFAYFSGVAVVAAYFTSRMSIAMGIIYSGVGIGAFATAPLLKFLTDEYGWRGALLIIGAVSFHICIYGLFFTPLVPFETHENKMVYEDIEINVEDVDMEKVRISHQHNDSHYDRSSKTTHEYVLTQHESNTEIEKELGCEKKASNENLSLETKQIVTFPHTQASGDDGQRPLLHNKFLDICESSSRSFNPKGSLDAHLNVSSSNGSSFAFASLKELRLRNSDENIHSKPRTIKKNVSRDVVFARSLKHLDTIVLSGSVTNLIKENEIQLTKETSLEYLNRNVNFSKISDSQHGETQDRKKKTLLCRYKKIILDTVRRNIAIMKDPVFIIFAVSNSISCLSYITPTVYLVDRALYNGLDDSMSAMLAAINGIGSIIGRIVFGFVTYRLFPDSLSGYIFVVAMAGISTMLSPLCGGSAALHVLYSAVLGFFIGGWCTLCAVAVLDLMGNKKGIEAFGLLLTFMGISSLLGPPLGGLFFDLTHTYFLTYIMHGFFLFISVIILMPMAFTRWRGRRRKWRDEKQLKSEKDGENR